MVESYTFWRTDKYAVGGGDYLSSQEATLKTGKKHWRHFKKQDQWFLSATGIGDVLKKHPGTIRRWIREKKLPATKLSGKYGIYLITREDILEFMIQGLMEE